MLNSKNNFLPFKKQKCSKIILEKLEKKQHKQKSINKKDKKKEKLVIEKLRFSRFQ